MWFVDKLGPSPNAPRANGGAQPAKTAAPKSAPASREPPAASAPAPEAPKKKKGWF